MKLMIDDAVWGYKEIFSGFGEITALPGRLITVSYTHLRAHET